MPEPQVKIVITGESGQAVQAAKQAEAQLKTLGETAKSTVAPGMDRVKEASAGAGAAIGKSFSALRQLANILPGLGLATLVGFVASAAAKFIEFAFGVGHASEALDGLKQKIDAHRTASLDALTNIASYKREIKSVGEEAKSAADYLASLNSQIDRQKSAELRKIDRQRDLDLARAGLIQDPAKRAQAEFDAETKYLTSRGQLEADKLKKRIAAENAAYQKAVRDKEEAEAAYPQAEFEAQQAKLIAIQSEAELKKAQAKWEMLKSPDFEIKRGLLISVGEITQEDFALADVRYRQQLDATAQARARADAARARANAIRKRGLEANRFLNRPVQDRQAGLASAWADYNEAVGELGQDFDLAGLRRAKAILHEFNVFSSQLESIVKELDRAAEKNITSGDAALRHWREANRRLEEVERRVLELRAALPGQ